MIGQDKVAKAGKANEISHFKPLLAPLPLAGTVITSDAMQANRDNSLFVRKVKGAHWLWPILGNQPNLNAELNALPWENTPVAAATSEIGRGRIETRTMCATRRSAISLAQRGEIGGISLDLMANLDLKGEGKNSMPENRRSCPGVWGEVPGDPRDMAKAGLH